jgi:ATP-dependent Clp endopeptidase proteolytic subunit ClpP
MKTKTWYQIQAKANNPKSADVSIHDEIGMWGVSASAFMRDLKAMGELDEINLSIHSPGGDVLDGWAIYNALKNSKAKITARVEGLAASMASVILMAADEIEIPENAYVMIHNPWGVAIGDAEELRDTAELLDKLGNGLVKAYTERTGNDEKDVREWMDAETWMDGKEAVERGFADTLLNGVALSARAFDTRKFRMTPNAIQANSESPEQVAPVEVTPTPAPVESQAPVEAEVETVVEETPAVVETEVEPQAKSLLSRFAALFGGETDETLKAELANKDDQIQVALKTIDSLKASLAEAKAKADQFDAVEAALAKREAEAQTAEQKAAAIVASVGFTPTTEEQLPQADGDRGDILERFNAITDPAERTKFYRENKAALKAAQFKS